MSKIAIALHHLIVGNVSHDPNAPAPFDLDDAMFAELETMGAVREANEAEAQIWAQRNGSAVEPAATDASAERAALEARAAALGIKFNKNLSSENLALRISDAKAAAAAEAAAEDAAETKLDI